MTEMDNKEIKTESGWKNLIRVIAFLLCLSLCMGCVSFVIERKSSKVGYMPIYDEKTDIDVLLGGSSHIMNSVFPYILWRDYGITSYNGGRSGQTIELTYFVLKEISKTIVPKVLVLDISKPFDTSDGKLYVTDGNIHRSLDFMPYDDVKLELAMLAANTKEGNLLDYLSNFYTYHERWKELKEDDFVIDYNKQKGANINTGSYPLESLPVYTDEFDPNTPEYDECKYFIKILDLCDEKGIDCYVINIPYPEESREQQAIIHTMMKIAQDRGVKTCNLLDNLGEIGLDIKTDFADCDHTNPLGAKKISGYVANNLIKEYQLTDHRGDDYYSGWNNFIDVVEDVKLKRSMSCLTALDSVQFLYDSEKYVPQIYCKEGVLLEDKEIKDYCKTVNLEIMDLENAPEDVKKIVNESEFYIDNDMLIVARNTETDKIAGSLILQYSKGVYKNGQAASELDE